jgi:hypothetical protein
VAKSRKRELLKCIRREGTSSVDVDGDDDDGVKESDGRLHRRWKVVGRWFVATGVGSPHGHGEKRVGG